MNDMTVQEARRQLERAATAGLGTAHDRRVHGWSITGTGVLIAALFPLTQATRELSPWNGVVTATYVVLVLAVSAWQKRSARVVPRHARRTGWIGLGCSAILGLAGVVLLNVWSPAWLYVVVALIAAIPSAVAGAAVVRSAR